MFRQCAVVWVFMFPLPGKPYLIETFYYPFCVCFIFAQLLSRWLTSQTVAANNIKACYDVHGGKLQPLRPQPGSTHAQSGIKWKRVIVEAWLHLRDHVSGRAIAPATMTWCQ